ncbi:13047_t:CDS:2, partial [Gigaspora rosea]
WKNVKKMKEPKIDDIIKKYLATSLKMQGYFQSTALSQQKPSEIFKMHLSACGRSKKNQPGNFESVVEAVVITNATTLEDFSILPLQQNENCFLVDNFREYASDIEF